MELQFHFVNLRLLHQ